MDLRGLHPEERKTSLGYINLSLRRSLLNGRSLQLAGEPAKMNGKREDIIRI